jgi:hypothetical protein
MSDDWRLLIDNKNYCVWNSQDWLLVVIFITCVKFLGLMNNERWKKDEKRIDERWLMNDGWWMMNDDIHNIIMIDDWWKMNDEWWKMDDNNIYCMCIILMMMKDEWWMMNNGWWMKIIDDW